MPGIVVSASFILHRSDVKDISFYPQIRKLDKEIVFTVNAIV